MSLARRIFTILLITFGSGLFTLSVWLTVTSPHIAFMAFLISSSGLILGYIGWVLRTPKSVKGFIRILLAAGLIVFGTGLTILALYFSLISGNTVTALILIFVGLAVSTGGWLLRKPKTPMSLIRNISSGILLTLGIGIFIFPIFILTLYGSNIAFANIAAMYFVLGLIIGLIGLSMRNQRSK